MSQEFFDEKKFGQYDYVVYYWGIYVGIFGLIGCFVFNIGFFIIYVDDMFGRE